MIGPGLLLLPDNLSLTTCSLKKTENCQDNVRYSEDLLNKYGIVFLPAVGYYSVTNKRIECFDLMCCYWCFNNTYSSGYFLNVKTNPPGISLITEISGLSTSNDLRALRLGLFIE